MQSTSQDATGSHSTPSLDSADAVFARRLREIRDIAGLTQQQVADRMTAAGHKMYRSQIGKIESGDRPVTIGEATTLANVLGVPLADLITDPGPAGQYREIQARLAAETAITSLTQQVREYLTRMREYEVLAKDARQQADEAEQRLDERKRQLAALLAPEEDDHEEDDQ